eukprot:gnl/Chilomastix_cuspidata/5485.p1 GENE.gnl/Chilomastix_cuspidata/5485~~gnl/Chilomastix_cuspidata/5485.p1  ORF type:complete len:266 (+),score=39.67 gnl/Chilomastix_cuspidata/5485:869-1666(+)
MAIRQMTAPAHTCSSGALSDDTLPRDVRMLNHRLCSCRRPEWITDQVFNTSSHLLSGAAFAALLPMTVRRCVESGRNSGEIAWVIIAHLSVINIFLASAVYHSVGLSGYSFTAYLGTRMWDHTAILVGIAANTQMVGRLALGARWSRPLAMLTILSAAAAIIGKLRGGEKQSTARFFASILGVAVSPLLLTPHLAHVLGQQAAGCLFKAAGAFVTGAAVYASRRITIVRGVFGAHEIWHSFTILGFAFLFRFISEHVVPAAGAAH